MAALLSPAACRTATLSTHMSAGAWPHDFAPVPRAAPRVLAPPLPMPSGEAVPPLGPPHAASASGALAVALGDGQELLPTMAQIFSRCCEGGAGAVANALPRLRVLSASFPATFPEALLSCTEMLLASAGACSSAAEGVAIDLIAAVAVPQQAAVAADDDAEAPDANAAAALLLRRLVVLLGGRRGGCSGIPEAPRRKQVRHVAAELLWRLLAALAGAGSTAEASALAEAEDEAGALESVLLRLSRDRAAPVRHAAISGLAVHGSEAALEALVELAAGDASSKVRLTAVAQLQVDPGDDPQRHQREAALCRGKKGLLERLAGRALDVSALVRGRFFAMLGGLRLEAVPPNVLAEALVRGLTDPSISVQAECECSLRAWLAQDSTVTDGADGVPADNGSGGSKFAIAALLRFLRLLRPGENRLREEAAELALCRLFGRVEWEPAAQAALQAIVDQKDALEPEVSLLARVAVESDVDAGSSRGRLGSAAVLQHTLRALAAGGDFELRQLLRVLQRAEIADVGAARDLLHLASALLLRSAPRLACAGPALHQPASAVSSCATAAPGGKSGLSSSTSVLQLAVGVAKRALDGAACARGLRGARAKRQALGEFSEALLVMLVAALRPPPQSSGAEAPEGGNGNGNGSANDAAAPRSVGDALEALEMHLDSAVAQDTDAARVVQESQAALSSGAARGDFARAREARERLAAVQAAQATAAARRRDALATLAGRLGQALGIVEAVLSRSQEGLSSDFAITLLLEDLLRPALALIDKGAAAAAAAGGSGGDGSDNSWLALRVLALRCIALHAMMAADTAADHWDFFRSVLARFAPVALAAGATPRAEAEIASGRIVEVCVCFLTDALLVHGHAFADEFGEELDDRSAPPRSCRVGEFFASIAPMLGAGSASGPAVTSSRQQGAPAATGRLPAWLRQSLARRLGSLLLFGDLRGSGGSLPTCGLGSSHAGVCWALTWLLVEAFAKEPPARSLAADNGDSVADAAAAAEAAVLRGQLLSAFGVLAGLSRWHAGLLVTAAECALSLETWELGRFSGRVPGKNGSSALGRPSAGERWRALPLPSFVRFLAKTLRSAATSPSSGEDLAEWWLQSLWRPLALAGLESAVVGGLGDAQLAEAMAAAVLGMAPLGSSAVQAAELPFAPEGRRPALAAEIAWVLNRLVELGGWNAVGGPRRHTAAGASAASAAGALPAALLELRDKCAEVAAAGAAGMQDWAATYRLAEKRRLDLRRAVAELGVNVRAYVASFQVDATAAEGAIVAGSAAPSPVLGSLRSQVPGSLAVRPQRALAGVGAQQQQQQQQRGWHRAGEKRKQPPRTLHGPAAKVPLPPRFGGWAGGGAAAGVDGGADSSRALASGRPHEAKAMTYATPMEQRRWQQEQQAMSYAAQMEQRWQQEQQAFRAEAAARAARVAEASKRIEAEAAARLAEIAQEVRRVASIVAAMRTREAPEPIEAVEEEEAALLQAPTAEALTEEVTQRLLQARRALESALR
eukprot:TRINITY_DN7450_c0_g1_i1.p1 TRINITY_DN7450_c0_g1~~TRINITY_DN7450_c0_g1_i1.p1  ORF type:complete len:1524 (+),score=398.26 TRINITY_DN7450_c0_g1_i1:78-4574(+)